jgi:hypothetical protein
MATAGKRARRRARRAPRQVTSDAPLLPPRKRREPKVPVRIAIHLNDQERSEICIETLVGLRTIQRFATGLAIARNTKVRIEQAMQKLAIERREKGVVEPHRRIVSLVLDVTGDEAQARESIGG